jgi:hypothetical protein
VASALLRQIARVAAAHADLQWTRCQRSWETCAQMQQRRLLRIVKEGADSEFGRRHGFHRIRSHADFVAALPLSQHPYLGPYIERCQRGEVSALLGPAQRLVMFALTSGTSGPTKALPVTRQSLAAYRWGWNMWAIRMLRDHPDLIDGRILQISSPAEESRTPRGIPCGAISGMLARNQQRIVRGFYALPYQVTEIADPDLRYYATMRTAVPQDVRCIVTANPSTLIALAKTAEARAEDLIRDVRDGTLAGSDDLPAEIRVSLRSHLHPAPDAARRLEDLVSRHGGLFPRDFWPSHRRCHWTGGTVGLYLPLVQRYYGDRPVRDIGLLASEGRMSLPVEDGTASGVLEIASSFYEFVPEEETQGLDLDPDVETLPGGLTVLLAEQLELGGRYSVFLTNGAGLYRYHVGDVVRVTGWRGSTPVIEFLSRGIHTSSLTGEKLTEHQVVTAVNGALRKAGLQSTCFVLTPVWAEPPYYRLFLEDSAALPPSVLQDVGRDVEAGLVSGNAEYATRRTSRRLGPVEVCILQDGQLSRLDHRTILNRGGRSEQFKHRFLLNEPIREADLTMEGGPLR